jgi:hypothetical protein
MNRTIVDPDQTIRYWRNSRLLLALIYLSAVLMMLMALLLLFAAIGSLMPFHASALGQAFMLVILGFGVAAGAAKVWGMGRNAVRTEARFEPDGVHFYYHSKETEKIGWQDISKVTHGGGQVMIHGADGQLLGFDGYGIFLPSRLGKAIAARAGKEFKHSREN